MGNRDLTMMPTFPSQVTKDLMTAKTLATKQGNRDLTAERHLLFPLTEDLTAFSSVSSPAVLC